MSAHLRRPGRGVGGSPALTTTGSSSGVEFRRTPLEAGRVRHLPCAVDTPRAASDRLDRLCHSGSEYGWRRSGTTGNPCCAPSGGQVQLSALRPLCDRPSSPGECSSPEKVLVREPVTVTEISTPQTASQTVKCSLGLCDLARGEAQQHFRWSGCCWWARQGLNL
jgi:hypothetical protein